MHGDLGLSDDDELPMGELPGWLFRAIVDNTAHPFIALSPEGVVCYVSPSFADLSGWRPEAMLGRNMIDFLPESEITKAALAFHELLTEDQDALSIPIVFEILGPDGESTWWDVGALPMEAHVGFDGTILRLRSWTHNHYFDLFLNALLGNAPISEVCEHLAVSITRALVSTGTLIHHGFDGSQFMHTNGSGVPPACVPPDSGPWHKAALTGQAVFATRADLPPRARTAAEEAGIEGIWNIPVSVIDDRPPAVLSVWRTSPDPPLLGHRMGLDAQSRYVQLALQRWAEHQRLIHIAGHDSLTGVANRDSFRDRLAEALAIGEQHLAVAFCDLDAFKPVNDTYGHHTGDLVLVQVAERLRSALRAGDELARLGGDEFTVLMRNVIDAKAAFHLAERLLAATTEPFDADGHPVAIGISVGVALVKPGMAADDLLGFADAALYEAKRNGGNRAHIAGS